MMKDAQTAITEHGNTKSRVVIALANILFTCCLFNHTVMS